MNRLLSASAILLLFGGVLGLASCDHAKKAVDAAREKFRGVNDPAAPTVPGGDVSPEMASQVDSAAEGVRFRRDLPFPLNVAVRSISRSTYDNTRSISTSAIGSETSVLNGTFEIVSLVERRGPHLALTTERAGEVHEKKENETKEEAKAAQATAAKASADSMAGSRIDFQLGPKGWRVPPSKGPAEFRLKAMEQEILPALPYLLSSNGLAARPQWFSASRRWAGGDRLVLEGNALGMILPPQATGKLTLVFEVSEPIDGHPCGRFSVQGEFTSKNEVSLNGEKSDLDTTITSGKIWCSLLHPLVLREEYDTVVTEVQGSGSNPKSRIQGSVKRVNTRTWTPTEAVTEG